MKKRFLSFVITLAMVISLVPMFSVMAFAKSYQASITSGGSTTNYYTTIQKAINAATQTDIITILEDVKLTSTLEIASTSTVSIDLNGHVLKGNGSGCVISNAGILTIKDSSPSAVHYYKYSSTVAWEYFGVDEPSGSVISTIGSIDDTTTHVKVFGGCITGGTSSGIYNTSDLTLNGGSVVGNGTPENGGGIKNKSFGKLCISGADIIGNKAEGKGGGLYSDQNDKLYTTRGNFLIENCNIQYNIAGVAGGGIYEATGECFINGTKITMADGKEKNIEDVKIGDNVKTFNHETGTSASEPVSFVYESDVSAHAMTLHFSNEIELGIVGSHGLLEKSSGKYVNISSDNVNDYIGKFFYNANTNQWEQLLSYSNSNEEYRYYSIYTCHHINCVANGLITVPDDSIWVLNTFDLDENLKIDAKKKAADIEKYGLMKYEDVKQFVSAEDFEIYDAKYFNVSIGKGLITFEELHAIYEEGIAYNESKKITALLNPMSMLMSVPMPKLTATVMDAGYINMGSNVIITKNKSGIQYTNDNLCIYNEHLDYAALIKLLNEPAGINVGINLTPCFGQFTTNGTSDDVKYFTSDSPIYKVKFNEGIGTGGYLELVNYNLSIVDSDTSAIALEIDNMTEAQAIAIARVQKANTQLTNQTYIAYAKGTSFALDDKYAVISANSTSDWATSTDMTLAQMKSDLANNAYYVIGTTKAAINPSVSIANWTYGGTPNSPSVTGNTGNGNVTYSYKVKGSADSTYSATTPSAVGEYVVKAEIASTDIYSNACVTEGFIISPKQLLVSGTTVSDKVYDGTTTAHAIVGSVDGIVGTDDVEVLINTAEYNSASVGEGKDVNISYKLSGAAIANYSVPDAAQFIASISKRTVVLTSASLSKQYDGTPLSSSDVEVGGEGFALEEGATYNVTGSQTEVGISDNTFTYELSAGTNPNNYTITKVFGKLEVTEKTTPQPTPQPPVYYDEPDPVVTVPVSGDKDTVKVQATVSGSNATVKNVTSDEINKVGTGSNVVMDLTSLSKSVTGVTIPKETFKNIAESNARGLEIKMPNGTVAVFDKTALAAIAAQAKDNNIKLVIDRDSKAEKSMSAAQKKTVGEMNNPVVLDAYFVSNGARISDFNGGEAEVTAEYPTEYPVRVWYVSDDGEKELVPSTYDGKVATFTVTHFSHYVVEQLDGSSFNVCPQDATCVYAKFPDTDTKAWYHDGVHFCVDKGIMGGYDNGKFGPTDTLSRAMVVQMLYNMEAKPTVSAKADFSDVEEGRWYADAVAWAETNGIAGGYGQGKFGPDDPITREQLAKILYGYAKYKGFDVIASTDLNEFIDSAKTSSWAVNELKWAKAVKLVNGKGNGIIDPTGKASRAEAATMFKNFCEYVVK